MRSSIPVLVATALIGCAAPTRDATDTARTPAGGTDSTSGVAANCTPIETRAANAPDQNVSSGSRFNSRVISTMKNPAEVRLQAQRDSVQPK